MSSVPQNVIKHKFASALYALVYSLRRPRGVRRGRRSEWCTQNLVDTRAVR